MNEFFLALLASSPVAIAVDAFAKARLSSRTLELRRIAGMWLNALIALFFFGLTSAASGNPTLALTLGLAVQLLLVLASNAKLRLLGEPLLFSDLSLIGAMFKHPRFYFSVLALWQKIAGLISVTLLTAVIVYLFNPSVTVASSGAIIASIAFALIVLTTKAKPFRNLARKPDIASDMRALGLVPSLLIYWLRWREAREILRERSTNRSTSVAEAPKSQDERIKDRLIIVVQCESFADPVDLFGDHSIALPALTAARAEGVQWGNLLVSGFGAYTMRTEYGVLFGCDEAELGFRLYDPYLTAVEDPALALPQKLGSEQWRSLFVHPHDMRFYGRHEILPAAGFHELVGEETFPKPDKERALYVSDFTVAEKILDIARAENASSLIYAVTMENHGPWADHGDTSADVLVESYVELVRSSDAMLGRLRDGLAELGRPATLVFFGDHRPTIPGASMPGGDRHTPYVIVEFGPDGIASNGEPRRCDLTPAELHHAILHWGVGGAGDKGR